MKVNVNTHALIDKLMANREKHRGVYLKAMDGYQRECIRVLEENLSAMRAGVKKTLYLHETMPVDHTRDYDTVIGLIGFSEGDQVELSAAEYRQYVLDDWEWKAQWTTTNSKFTGQTDE